MESKLQLLKNFYTILNKTLKTRFNEGLWLNLCVFKFRYIAKNLNLARITITFTFAEKVLLFLVLKANDELCGLSSKYGKYECKNYCKKSMLLSTLSR